MDRPTRLLRHPRTVAGILLLVMVCVAACSSANSTPSSTPTTTPISTVTGTPPAARGALRAQGSQIVDATGQSILLRGAMIESSFAYINRWQRGQDPTQTLSPATFAAMASWHMNVVRINISYWIYQLDPTLFMSRLDQVVQNAHAAGLYVVLDYHDDGQSGNPAPDGMIHAETVTFWTILATHYAKDPLMIFDPINEPKYTDWQTWLSGNGAGVLGYQQVIAAIRGAGAQQLIVLEPGPACGCGHTIWQGADNFLPSDSNVLFSLHVYNEIISGNPQTWDAAWGPLLGHHPLYYGEWAVLPNSNTPSQCSGLTSDNADAITNAFLNYTQARQINWTAWQFSQKHLVQDYATYAPTTFATGASWACQDPSAAQAGMGSDVKQFLAAHPAAKAQD